MSPRFICLNASLMQLAPCLSFNTVGYPKITKDNSFDANLTSTRRLRFKLKHRPGVQRSMKTLDAGMSKPAFNTGLSNSVFRPTRVWVTPRSMSSAVWATWRFTLDVGLRNPASYFKCGSGQLGVLLQMRVWKTLRLTSNVSLSNSTFWVPASTTSNARSASARDPRFYYNGPPLLGN